MRLQIFNQLLWAWKVSSQSTAQTARRQLGPGWTGSCRILLAGAGACLVSNVWAWLTALHIPAAGGVPGPGELETSDQIMEALYCQEELERETSSPDQGYKTDYSVSMANWPTVTKVMLASDWLTGSWTRSLISRYWLCVCVAGWGGPDPAGGQGVPQHDRHGGLLHLRQQLLWKRPEGNQAPHEEARHRLDAWGINLKLNCPSHFTLDLCLKRQSI